MKTGFILFAHGSSVEPANEAVRALARQVAESGGFPYWETAFLELGKPDLAEALQRLAAYSLNRVVIIPYFLTLGIHLRRDLPKLVEALASEYPNVVLHVTEPLDGHPALRQIVLERAQEALAC